MFPGEKKKVSYKYRKGCEVNEMTKNGRIGLSQVSECGSGHPATLQEQTVNGPDDLVRGGARAYLAAGLMPLVQFALLPSGGPGREVLKPSNTDM